MADLQTPAGGRRLARSVGVLADRPWIPVLLVAAAAFALWAVGTRSQPHHVRVAFPAATQLVEGLDVQLNGIDAGKISDISYTDGQAVVELGIYDDAWPLPRGTTAAIRYGSTIATGARRIDLHPGSDRSTSVPEGGVISPTPSEPLVEIDQVINAFDPRTRRHMQRMLRRTGAAIDGRGPALGRGLEATPEALKALGGVFDDLAREREALRGVVVNGHRATRVLAAQEANIADLVSVGSATFDTFARHSAEIRSSLDELPAAMHDVRGALGRLGASSDLLRGLFRDLAPGARELRPLARQARTGFAELRRTAPQATSAVKATVAAAPSISGLLREGARFSRLLEPVARRLRPVVGCLRPYAPEIAGFLATWAGYGKNYDATSHYARVHVTASPTSNHFTPPDLKTSEYLTTFPQLNYAMPRPPGYNVEQPWFQQDCGIGPEALDPGKDPEDRR